MAGRKRQPILPRVWPEKPLMALAAHWRLGSGEHPRHADDQAFFSLPSFPDRAFFDTCDQQSLPFSATTCGHHTLEDVTYAHAAGVDAKVPISPLFVRDLAGRVIYVGYDDPAKKAEMWPLDRRVTFPKHCQDVTASVPGSEWIENVFFTRFRCLDAGFAATHLIAGEPDVLIPAIYANPHFYPYKLRVDSFYQDGWRLPQTECVYARSVQVETAEAAAQELLARWNKRPEGQDYEAFYSANEGETWFENLFLQGCSVIPTLEAANGYNHVGENFELQDFWPGRAVTGLHKVLEECPNQAPKGTILAVVQPGYVTCQQVHPAQVIVSDGSGYRSVHSAHAPQAQLPDLRLPHPRTSHKWGVTWLPTHPAHFEAPALWEWEVGSGHFVQKSGPLWDPVHYYYASVPKIIRAHRENIPENPHFSKVPAEMKQRFYPVVEMQTYDTFSEPSRQRRQEVGMSLVSALDAVPVGKVCSVGYHPLPAACEYELEPFWLPELDPRQRVIEAVSEDMKKRLVSPISSQITREQAQKTVVALQPTPWIVESHQAESKGWQQDYPQLQRYLNPVAENTWQKIVPAWLLALPNSIVMVNVKRLMGGAAGVAALESLQPGFASVVQQWRTENLARRRLRYRLWERYGPCYAAAWWSDTWISGATEKELKTLGTQADWQAVLAYSGVDVSNYGEISTQPQAKQVLDAA